MEFSIDLSEMERQRYDAIKKKGRYIEADILIESTKENEHDKMPVVTTVLHGCNSKDISYMYVTLKALINQFTSNYPLECAIGETLMTSTTLGDIETRYKKDEEED